MVDTAAPLTAPADGSRRRNRPERKRKVRRLTGRDKLTVAFMVAVPSIVVLGLIWLPAIASVFVGGTPTWGGVGTIAGGAIGALIVSFIQSGVVAAGLSGFYVQFFNGLIIILALLGHRWNQKRFR